MANFLDSVPPGGEWQREAEEAEVISLLANQLSAQQKPALTGLTNDGTVAVSSSSGDNSSSQQLILTSMSPPKSNIFFNIKNGASFFSQFTKALEDVDE